MSQIKVKIDLIEWYEDDMDYKYIKIDKNN